MPSLSRFKNSIMGRSSSPSPSREGSSDASPEGEVRNAVRLFCESGTSADHGEEVTHLPVIVEGTVSSPAAASAAAYQIRKYLGSSNTAAVQYNAIMLLRILAENPGPDFTRNIDGKFVNTVSDLVRRRGGDQSVHQLLCETLDALEAERSYDQNLKRLLQMWQMNKPYGARLNAQSIQAAQWASMSGANGSVPPPPSRRLPSQEELASRVEESRNSAKILVQLVQSTPADQILTDALIKEFTERCQKAQSSLQNFISCDDPSPDPDTMQTLIETSEQLSLSLSKAQRAKLSARRTLSPSLDGAATPASEADLSPPEKPSRNFLAVPGQERSATPEPTLPTVTPSQDPFADSAERSNLSSSQRPHRRSAYMANQQEQQIQQQQTQQQMQATSLMASGANGTGAAASSGPSFAY